MDNEINLWSLLKFYAQHWYIIALLGLAGLAAGFAYNTFIQTPLYKSDVKVTFINGSTQTSSRTVRDISNYADLVKSRSVLTKAIESSNEDITYDSLAGATTVKNDKNTDVLDISVTTPNSYRSAALAGGILTAFKQEVVNVYKIPENEVRIIDHAQRVDTPVNVRLSLQLLLASGAGLLIAIILLFFIFDFRSSQPEKKEAPQTPRTPSFLDDDDDDMGIPDDLINNLPKSAKRPLNAQPKTTKRPSNKVN